MVTTLFTNFNIIFQHPTILDAGAISGICLAAIGLSCIVIVTAVLLYRRRYINKPQTLSEPDSSGYIDDCTVRVCLLNNISSNHIVFKSIIFFRKIQTKCTAWTMTPFLIL